MNRAARRRAVKEENKSKTATYNLTKKQLDDAIEKGIAKRLEEIKDDAAFEAVNTSMTLTFALPMKVLMKHYWQNDYKEKIPEFAEKLLELYQQWASGELDIDELNKEVWDTAGIQFAVDD